MERAVQATVLAALGALALLASSPRGAAQAPAEAPLRDAATLGLVVYNPANQHHYQPVRVTDGITWEQAYAAAASRTVGGVRGYLVCVNDDAEQAFLNANLLLENSWMGAYRDRNAPDYKQKQGGWRWISGEPFQYTFWNDTEPNNTDVERNAAFWIGNRWMDVPPDHRVSSYAIEFPTTGPVGDSSKPAGEQVEALLTQLQQKNRGLRSYQATVQFSSKALLAQGRGLNVQLTIQPPGRFRLEGRGNNGSLLAISDGRGFVVARTIPGEPMRWMLKPSRGLQSLEEAMSLLIDAPLPPSLTGFVLRTVAPSLWSGGVRLGGCRDEAQKEEMIRSRVKMQFIGDDAKDAEAVLMVSQREGRILSSEINYRDADLVPTTVRETHTNVRINEAVPPDTFTFNPPPTAIQVDDLGERAGEVSYTPARK